MFSSTVRSPEQADVLERARETAPREPVRRPAVDVDCRRASTTPGRALEARHDVDERRLPGAVGPDQPEDLAARELQVDAVDGLDALEMHLDVGDLQEVRAVPYPRIALGYGTDSRWLRRVHSVIAAVG